MHVLFNIDHILQNPETKSKSLTTDVNQAMAGSTGIIIAALVDKAKQMKEGAAKMKDEEKVKRKKVIMK